MKKLISGILATSIIVAGLGTQSVYALNKSDGAISNLEKNSTHNSSIKLKAKNNNRVKLIIGDYEPFDKDGKTAKAVMKHGRVLVPFRTVAEFMGGTMKFNTKTKTATVTRKGKKVEVTSKKKYGFANGKKILLDEPVQIIKGRTYIPIRFLSKGLGAEVEWVKETQTVNVTILKNLGEKYYYADEKGKLGTEITSHQANLKIKQGISEGREIVHIDETMDVTTKSVFIYESRVGKYTIDGQLTDTALSIMGTYNKQNLKPFSVDYTITTNIHEESNQKYFKKEGKTKTFKSANELKGYTTQQFMQDTGLFKAN